MKYKWKSGINNTSYYHDENGKIHGEVNRVSFSDDTYYATLYPANGLGKYISEATAKKAIENQIDDPLFNIRGLYPNQEHDTSTYGLYEPGLKFDLTPPEDDLAMYNEQTYNFPSEDGQSTYTVSLSLPEEEPPTKKKKKK